MYQIASKSQKNGEKSAAELETNICIKFLS